MVRSSKYIYYYDIFGAFRDLKVLDWKQTSTIIAVGDSVYIYVSNPIRAIMFKCKVNKVNLLVSEIDDSKYVVKGDAYQNYNLKLNHYNNFSFENNHFIKAIFGSRINNLLHFHFGYI